MASRRVRLTFPDELIDRPVIYDLGHEFQIVTNIRRASVDQTSGWVVLEMTGSDDELQRGIDYLESLGVRVEPIEKDIMES